MNPIQPPMTIPVNGWDVTSKSYFENKDILTVKECNTCGRKYAIVKGTIEDFCCSGCKVVWTTFQQQRPDELLDLYFYRVKVPAQLNADEIGNLYWSEFSYLQLQILLELKKSVDHGQTATNLVEKIFGLYYTKTGMVRHRTYVIAECNRLAKAKLVRSYRERQKTLVGKAARPRTKFVLTSNIVTLKTKCSNCHNQNYRFLEKQGRVKCIYCGLEWEVPEIRSELM